MPASQSIVSPTLRKGFELGLDLTPQTLVCLDIWAEGSVTVTDIEDNETTRDFTGVSLPYRWTGQWRLVESEDLDEDDMDAYH